MASACTGVVVALVIAACSPAMPAAVATLPAGPADEREPPRVIAGRWAITTTSPMPFARESIERGFEDAHDRIAACLRQRLLPPMTVNVRLIWADGKLAATVVTDDRDLGACAAAALAHVRWVAPRSATLDVIITTREPMEHD